MSSRPPPMFSIVQFSEYPVLISIVIIVFEHHLQDCKAACSAGHVELPRNIMTPF
jgi:hypothetical protein